MIRRIILAAALAVTPLAGLAMTTSTADAHPPVRHDRDCDNFQVLVRHGRHWDVHGTFRDRDDAQRAARQLRRQGLDVDVRRV